MTYFTRYCCQKPAEGGFIYDLVESSISTFTGSVIRLDVQLPEPTLEVATHEAGHAVAHYLFGQMLAEVRVTEPAQCQYASGSRLDSKQALVVKLAGIVAEDRLKGEVVHTSGYHLRRYFEKIRALHLGACDTCQAVLCAISAVGADAGNGRAFRFYRRAEDAAINMMSDIDVWAGVMSLAERLLLDGIVDGKTAHSILSQHIAFGSYADKELHV